MRRGWRRRWQQLSLEHQLPLLITGVLALVLASSLLLTYGALARSAELSLRERIDLAVEEVATSAAGSAHDNLRRLRLVAADPTLLDALAAGTADAPAHNVLAPILRTRNDSLLPIAVFDRDGRWLYARGTVTAADSAAVQRFIASARTAGDTALLSPLYAADTSVHWWSLATRSGGAGGWVGQVRRVGGPREATQTLRALLGEQLDVYLRNADGSLWSLAPGAIVDGPTARDSGPRGVMHRRPSGAQFVAEAPVEGAPWVMVFEAPRSAAFASARRTLALLGGVSLVLMAVGVVLARLIGRRVTRPLGALTAAAEEMAQGRAAPAIIAEGSDEIERLGRSFSQMATEVAAARAELEHRVEEAQSAATMLAGANERLQHAIDDAEQAREESERASRAKSDFLAMMSHELRTPLNAIGGYTQLLELELFGAVTDSQRDTLGRIAHNQAHLLRLIDDVLNFARIDAGQLEYQLGDVAVGAALANVEALIAPQMRAKELTLDCASCDDALAVHADRERLQQILLNLLANAVKFTPPGGQVRVSAEPMGDAVRIRVRDTGVGIPAEQLATIFEPFVQGDRALNRPHEGVGLGLAISRDLARGMGGDLSAESTPGVGSTFIVTLPRRRGADATNRAPAGRRTPASSSTVSPAGSTQAPLAR